MLGKQFWRLLGLLSCVFFIASAIAATERYDYDPLGRLVRVVNDSNQATDYIYDAAGNLLEVRGNGTLAAPAVAGITPISIRRSETKAITITGNGFLGANVSFAGTEFNISSLQVTATQIKFNLAVSAAAPVGAQSITISSAAGSTSASITVAPLLPSMNVDPTPLAIPPDGVSRQITLRLSNVDAVDHAVALSASNSNITISPATVNIPAGQLSVPLNITGVNAGQANITLTSTTLGTLVVPVFVTAEFRGISTSIAPPLGVVLESTSSANQIQITPVASVPLGVLVGSGILGIVPDSLNVGTGPTTLTINGVGLAAAQTVSIEPSTGLTLGSLVAAPDGLSATIPVTVTADSPISLRRLILKNANGVAFPVVSPTTDRIDIVRPAPQVDSIEPLFAIPDTNLTLTVRGHNLHGAKAVLFSPSTGISIDATPAVNNEGTALTARVAIALNTPIGDYVVIVTTPGGSSAASADISNTFKVVSEISQDVTPITAPVVGVVLQDNSLPAGTPTGLTSSLVGITVGSAATGLSPKVGIIGQDMVLTVQGSELYGVTSIDLIPNTGLTLGSVTVAPDGKSVTLPMTVAQEAPLTLRKVKVMAGATEVKFSSPEASQFRISLPLPEVDSVTPIALQIGQSPTLLTVRGRNFQNATQVKVEPAADLTLSSPPIVNGDGTEITVSISAAANAAVGTRLVTVATPAGESSVTLAPSNSITLSNTAGSNFGPVIAASVGVVKLDGSAVPATVVGPILAPTVGVMLESVPTPMNVVSTQFANALGVALGATAFNLDANGFAPGFNGTLVVHGYQLNALSAVSVVPSAGITLGAPTIAPDGSQASMSIAVDAGAAHGPRTVKLSTSGGDIYFGNPSAAQLRVGPGVPQLDSITPILGRQGETVTMTIRGSQFEDAIAVQAAPGSGITFIPGTLVVNGDGTQLSVSFVVEPTAPLGSQVIQVVVPGAVSNAAPVPANTFTVISP